MPEVGQNIKNPIRIVRHADLERLDDDSLFRSVCPVCAKGSLLIHRSLNTFELSNLDNCTLCGQRFLYRETHLGVEELRPYVPRTFEDAVVVLDTFLTDVEKALLERTRGSWVAARGSDYVGYIDLISRLHERWLLADTNSHLRRNCLHFHGLEDYRSVVDSIFREYAATKLPVEVHSPSITRYQRLLDDDDSI